MRRTANLRHVGACCLLFGMSLGLAGCGPAVGQVAGKVTHKGAPVAGAELAFTSDRPGADHFSGLSGEDGTYQVSYRELRGLPVGRYAVTVSRYVQAGDKPLPPGEAGALLKANEQAFQQSFVFEKDVAAGPNTIDFELTEGKPAPK